MKVHKEVTYVERDALKDRINGGMRHKYIKVGTVFKRPDGSEVVKLDTIPVNFNGWFELYTPRPIENED